MHFLERSLVLFVSQWTLVLTQQTCYWPNGSEVNSGQDEYVNCYSSQDSTCCNSGEACLSNGLCYGAQAGWTYRGACTVKDWSNTTACPTQWCNDVVASGWAHLWMCPPNSDVWWCGIGDEEPCQSGNGVHFNTYTAGSILGLAPITNSPSSAKITSAFLLTTTFSAGPSSQATTVSTSSPAKVSTDHTLFAQTQRYSTSLPVDVSTPSQDQKYLASPSTTAGVTPTQSREHSTKLPTTIGVAVGIPLGIMAVGFLVLAFWKETMRQRRSDSRIPNQELVSTKGGVPVPAAGISPRLELADTQILRELGDTGKRELPSM